MNHLKEIFDTWQFGSEVSKIEHFKFSKTKIPENEMYVYGSTKLGEQILSITVLILFTYRTNIQQKYAQFLMALPWVVLRDIKKFFEGLIWV